jgi:tetratricopeptide (TPR) repeat protein
MLRSLLSSIFHRSRAPVAVQDVIGLIDQGRHDEAHRMLGRSWKNATAYWELLGYLESSLGDFQAAVDCFAQGLDVDGDAVGLRINRAAALQVIDRLDESERQYERLLAAFPENVDLLLGAGFVKRRSAWPPSCGGSSGRIDSQVLICRKKSG